MTFIITSSLSPKAVPSMFLMSCRKAPKDHLFLLILPSVSVQLLQCKRIATFLFKHISQCLNNWKSIFRKLQLKTRHFLCIYNMCHWIVFENTVHRLFKLLLKVKGHCHWLHCLLFPLWLVIVRVCWESGQHRLLLVSLGTRSHWLQQPIIAE